MMGSNYHNGKRNALKNSSMETEINPEDLDIDAILSLSAEIYNLIDPGRVWNKVKECYLSTSPGTGCNVLNRRCDICLEYSPTAQEIISHRLKHTSDIKYTCLICYKTRSTRKLLRKHIIAAHYQSDKHVKTVALLSRSENGQCSSKSDIRCDICRLYFPTAKKLIKHRYQHTCDKKYTCLICFKRFGRKTQKSFLKAHIRSVHNNLKYQCHICIKEYNWKSSLREHYRVHDNISTDECYVCHKKFVSKQSLAMHKVVHSEKKFECDVCHARFKRHGHLNNHKRIHAKIKDFKCDTCNKRFADKGNLDKHKVIHTGERPYKCNICHKRYTQSSHLRIHKRLHTGERPYKCEICEKTFIDKSRVRIHMRIHTGEKPYKCNICSHRCNQRSSMNVHKRTHL